MSYSRKELIEYRFTKAVESLEEAEAIANLEHWDTVANRLYYACFYAVSAYLANEELQATTHRGVKAALHKELIKPGLLPVKLGKTYNDLFNKRQEADYKDFLQFEKDDILPLMSEARAFVSAVERVIRNS